MIALDQIRPSRDQARTVFDEDGLRTLAASIRAQGLMQPMVVREIRGDRDGGGGGGGGGFELVAGERRWRAARLAGLERAPCHVVEIGDEDAAQLGLIENIQREDLNAVDRARGFANLRDRYGWTQEMIAERVGLDRSSVSNQLRILELEEPILAMISAGTLEAGHGKALLSAPSGSRAALAARAAGGSWSVRDTERAAKAAHNEGHREGPSGAGASSGAKGTGPSPVIADLERTLGETLGTRVRIRARGGAAAGKGMIEIEYYDLDHFEGLVTRMGATLDRS